jgi:hypothetical protein
MGESKRNEKITRISKFIDPYKISLKHNPAPDKRLLQNKTPANLGKTRSFLIQKPTRNPGPQAEKESHPNKRSSKP